MLLAVTRSPCSNRPLRGSEATSRDTKQQEGEERWEGKIGRKGRLRQELQLHTTKQKSLNKLYSTPPSVRYVISLRRLMVDREIPVFSIISAGHASTKRVHLSRVFSQRISFRRCFFSRKWELPVELYLLRLICLLMNFSHNRNIRGIFV